MSIQVPMTKFNVVDQSAIPDVSTATVSSPLFMYAFSSDKGPEEMTVVDSFKLFGKLYGTNISFAKHGQPLLQAARTSEVGGKILAKRVVADDATLANALISAKVTLKNEQKVDTKGNLLFIDSTGKETVISEGNAPVMQDVCYIKYVCDSIPSIQSAESINTFAEGKIDEVGTDGVFTYPLFTIFDNGRGISNKKFRISADYDNSKHISYMKYKLAILEGTELLEDLPFTSNPDIVESAKNRSIENVVKVFSNQIRCNLYETNFFKFVEKVSEISGNVYEDCLNNDIFFAKTRTKGNLNKIVIDYTSEDAFNLSYTFGIPLKNGSNGAFGNYPFGVTAYNQQITKFFAGEYTADIYDLDNYSLDLIVDANYPASAKRAIEALVAFREDAQYARDLGLGLKTEEDILAANLECSKNRYSTSYHLDYDIIDPYTKKQIKVTMCYSLAIILVSHFRNGRNRPVSGQLYNIVLSDAIKGTESFLPKVTPLYDQKQTLADNRINYASYFDGQLVVETEWTSQPILTQLSFTNNVLAMQEVLKAVRIKCPKSRYSFISGDDLDTYMKDVQAVLDKYSNNFVALKMVYVQDETMVVNKVFHAAIQMVFKNFVQKEYFTIYALNSITE